MHRSQPPRIALKIDIATYRAARDGLPHLLDLLRRNRATASFAVACGPDRSGRALLQAFSPARFGRATSATLTSHFGASSLCRGSLLPAPSIAARCAASLRQAIDDGCEIGIGGWDALAWANEGFNASAAWTTQQLDLACKAFEQACGMRPVFHAAPAWRSPPHALRLTQRLGFKHASDCRGRHPFLPVWNGEIVRCPQFPTTLPTIDELARRGQTDLTDIRDQLLALTTKPTLAGHVFSLRAPHRAGSIDTFLESLFAGWREQGYELTSVQTLAGNCDMDKLPRHQVVVGSVPGRYGSVLLQGDEFLSEWRQAA